MSRHTLAAISEYPPLMASEDTTFELLADSGLLTGEQLATLGNARTADQDATWDALLSDLDLAEQTLSLAVETISGITVAVTTVGTDEAVTAESYGRYQPLTQLGAGGMASVELVEDAHLHRRVARKEMRINNPPMIARFLREARITAQLEHPGIVPVYELGRRSDGRLYYTMKRVRGETLKDALEKCATLDERLALLGPFVSLCQAVGYAHSKGVFHRDLKPENVMIGPFGETLVVDWGLAKVAGESDNQDAAASLMIEAGDDGALTRAGTVMGTPLYMSPEQAQGRMSAVDARSDVWSLGAMLFEVLTGEQFWNLGARRIIESHCRSEVPPIATRLGEAPAPLAAILLKAMSADPAERYADGSAVAAEVEAWRTGGMVEAHVYSVEELAQQEAANVAGAPLVDPGEAVLTQLRAHIGRNLRWMLWTRRSETALLFASAPFMVLLLLLAVPHWSSQLIWLYLMMIYGLGGVVGFQLAQWDSHLWVEESHVGCSSLAFVLGKVMAGVAWILPGVAVSVLVCALGFDAEYSYGFGSETVSPTFDWRLMLVAILHTCSAMTTTLAIVLLARRARRRDAAMTLCIALFVGQAALSGGLIKIRHMRSYALPLTWLSSQRYAFEAAIDASVYLMEPSSTGGGLDVRPMPKEGVLYRWGYKATTSADDHGLPAEYKFGGLAAWVVVPFVFAVFGARPRRP